MWLEFPGLHQLILVPSELVFRSRFSHIQSVYVNSSQQPLEHFDINLIIVSLVQQEIVLSLRRHIKLDPVLNWQALEILQKLQVYLLMLSI